VKLIGRGGEGAHAMANDTREGEPNQLGLE